MTAREEGFLLLSCHLGDVQRPVLTTAQLRTLAVLARQQVPQEPERDILPEDLQKLGCSPVLAQQVVGLLSQQSRLRSYIDRGRQFDCQPISRVSPEYPAIVRQRLGLDSPGCLWAKGDTSLLQTPAIALVGSRDLLEANREFARCVGREAALRGITLVSGNARGADRIAQNACLDAGGRVISIVADALWRQPLRRNVLYLSEGGFDEPFSSQRALSRNRCIHGLGRMVFVAQAELGKGGSWGGTVQNLRSGWSNVVCFRDGSPASLELERRGAYLASMEELPEYFAEPFPGQMESLF